MNVRELIDILKTFDEELPVLAAVPDADFDKIKSASVVEIVDSGRRLHMCGRYQEAGRFFMFNAASVAEKPFDALVLDTE